MDSWSLTWSIQHKAQSSLKQTNEENKVTSLICKTINNHSIFILFSRDNLLIVWMVSGSSWLSLMDPCLKNPRRVMNFIRPSGKSFSCSAADGYEYFFLIWKNTATCSHFLRIAPLCSNKLEALFFQTSTLYSMCLARRRWLMYHWAAGRQQRADLRSKSNCWRAPDTLWRAATSADCPAVPTGSYTWDAHKILINSRRGCVPIRADPAMKRTCVLGEGWGQYRGGEGRYSPFGTKIGKHEHRCLAVSSKEDNGADTTLTPAMTEAFRISWIEICSMSQSSPSWGSGERSRDKAQNTGENYFFLMCCANFVFRLDQPVKFQSPSSSPRFRESDVSPRRCCSSAWNMLPGFNSAGRWNSLLLSRVKSKWPVQ